MQPTQLHPLEQGDSGSEPSGFGPGLARLFALKPIQIVAAFALIAAVMAAIEFAGPAILDNDGFYHIRWSRMLRESFPHLPAFKALPLTTLSENRYVDHHFLFHMLLTPFTFGDLRIGAKLAAACFSTIGIGSLFALLVTYRVPYRWLWLLPLVAGSEPFLYRLSMTRAPSLSLAFLAIGLYLILERKHIWLGVLAFAFVWLYSLFPLLLAFAALYSVALYLSERRIDLWAPFASLIGILAGMVVNPYFPRNWVLMYQHLLMKLTADYAVEVGVEWYPYDTWDFLTLSVIAFAIFLAALAAFQFRSRLTDLRPLFFLMASTLLLLLAFKSRRFIEYWPPFAVLFAAFTVSPRLEKLTLASLSRRRDRLIAAAAASAVTCVLLLGMGYTVWQAGQDMKAEQDPYAYRGASEWLVVNTQPGSMVFNTDWDDFPMLFFFNPNGSYVAGLDPTYLYDRDRELWRDYERVTLGEEEDPAPIIRDSFGAEYVFTDNQHEAFLNIAEASGDFEEVYRDSYATVLRVLRPEEHADESRR